MTQNDLNLRTLASSSLGRATERGPLSPEQVRFWNQNDYLVIQSFFTKEQVQQMVAWVKEIEAWPLATGRHLNYFEIFGDEKRLSRTENFLPYHPEFNAFMRKSGVFEIMEQIFNEPVILFKEKINYKYPGTGEYPPHQDVHAYDTSPYAFQPYHLNMAIFLDAADAGNGCMELGEGYPKFQVLDRHPSGALKDHVVESLDWKPIEVTEGSLFIMDMFWPHRSSINRSDRPRRALFLTLNGASKGDLRAAHYQDRASGKAKSREIKSNLVVQTVLLKNQSETPSI